MYLWGIVLLSMQFFQISREFGLNTFDLPGPTCTNKVLERPPPGASNKLLCFHARGLKLISFPNNENKILFCPSLLDVQLLQIAVWLQVKSSTKAQQLLLLKKYYQVQTLVLWAGQYSVISTTQEDKAHDLPGNDQAVFFDLLAVFPTTHSIRSWVVY